MRRTNGLAIAFFIATFAAGAAAGVVTDRYLERERREQQWSSQAMRDRLAMDLGMSPAQRAGLDTILDARNRQYDSTMALVRPRLDSLGTQARQRIRQLLTPEQQATYDQILRERDEARRQERR